jgi:hypothetical protein
MMAKDHEKEENAQCSFSSDGKTQVNYTELEFGQLH